MLQFERSHFSSFSYRKIWSLLVQYLFYLIWLEKSCDRSIVIHQYSNQILTSKVVSSVCLLIRQWPAWALQLAAMVLTSQAIVVLVQVWGNFLAVLTQIPHSSVVSLSVWLNNPLSSLPSDTWCVILSNLIPLTMRI